MENKKKRQSWNYFTALWKMENNGIHKWNWWTIYTFLWPRGNRKWLRIVL